MCRMQRQESGGLRGGCRTSMPSFCSIKYLLAVGFASKVSQQRVVEVDFAVGYEGNNLRCPKARGEWRHRDYPAGVS